VSGGEAAYGGYCPAGLGRVRFDVMDPHFTGTVNGVFTQGFQPIVLLPSNGVSLAIQRIGDAIVGASPSGFVGAPDVMVGSQQTNPVPIVVQCLNIPLGSPITVDVKPANGQMIESIGFNNVGTQASSIATVFVTMPRGGGTIEAKAVSGITNSLVGSLTGSFNDRSYAQTGLTIGGQRFTALEITAALAGPAETVYVSERGERFRPSVR
jgi:hypothetical protein